MASRDLTQTTVLITGAGGGIGRSVTARLSSRACRMILVDRRQGQWRGLDLGEPQGAKRLARYLQSNRTPLDWVIHLVGWIDEPIPFAKQSPRNINRTVASNLFSAMYVTRELTPFVRTGGGVIMIASTAGLRPNGRYAAYSSAKAGVIAFMRAMASSAPDLPASDIRFITVCPGPTNTDMRQKLSGDAALHQSPDIVAGAIEKIVATRRYRNGDVILVEKGRTRIVSRL